SVAHSLPRSPASSPSMQPAGCTRQAPPALHHAMRSECVPSTLIDRTTQCAHSRMHLLSSRHATTTMARLSRLRRHAVTDMIPYMVVGWIVIAVLAGACGKVASTSNNTPDAGGATTGDAALAITAFKGTLDATPLVTFGGPFNGMNFCFYTIPLK